MSHAQNMFDGETLIAPGVLAFDRASSHAPGGETEFAVAKAQLALVLHMIERQFQAGAEPGKLAGRLVGDMHRLRRDCSLEVWRQLVPIAQAHPIADFVHQDPFTRWSFEKPRGYSGDAQLLDFIYGHESAAPHLAAATPLGRAIHAYTHAAPACAAVRERRDLLARHVDEIAARHGAETEILTVAAGHLREAGLSVALGENRIRRWVALDQDPASIATIAHDHADCAVEPFVGSVRGLLGNAYDLGRFDFIYAAGLYDYLPRPAAVKLTRRCMEALKPGGTFLFANFFSDIPDDGYMETFMNWPLILRSEAEMWDIVNASVDRNMVEASVVFGANRNIVYAIIRRRD